MGRSACSQEDLAIENDGIAGYARIHHMAYIQKRYDSPFSVPAGRAGTQSMLWRLDHPPARVEIDGLETEEDRNAQFVGWQG